MPWRPLALTRTLVGLACAAMLAGGLAAAAPTTASAAPTGEIAGIRLPLHTDEQRVVDRTGKRAKFAAVNWFGAESGEFVVGGLDKQRAGAIARLIKRGGFNAVRLPWSNELVESNPVVADEYLTANPRLRGKRALELFDIVVDELGRNGLMVILDNHRSRGDWCCDEAHGDGLWHTPEYPESAWLADWALMARRYRDRPHVVAAELRNEIRPDPSQGLIPTWGDGNPETDWRAAAERGGDAVLKANPRLLIIVGGTDYQGHLRYVPDAPVRLAIPHKLVYAVHDYPWNHPITELQGDDVAFRANLDARWGFVTEPGHPWTAPVLLSEFGGCTQPRDDGSLCTEDRLLYPYAIARYLRATDLDWVWWPLNGTQSAGYNRVRGAVETWGLLNPQWSDYANPDLMAELRSLIRPGDGPHVIASGGVARLSG